MQIHFNTRVYLKHLDVDAGLIVSLGGEDFALAGWNDSVAFHHIGHDPS